MPVKLLSYKKITFKAALNNCTRTISFPMLCPPCANQSCNIRLNPPFNFLVSLWMILSSNFYRSSFYSQIRYTSTPKNLPLFFKVIFNLYSFFRAINLNDFVYSSSLYFSWFLIWLIATSSFADITPRNLVLNLCCKHVQ